MNNEKPYQPTEGEIKDAEYIMTSSQKKLSELRQAHLEKMASIDRPGYLVKKTIWFSTDDLWSDDQEPNDEMLNDRYIETYNELPEKLREYLRPEFTKNYVTSDFIRHIKGNIKGYDVSFAQHGEDYFALINDEFFEGSQAKKLYRKYEELALSSELEDDLTDKAKEEVNETDPVKQKEDYRKKLFMELA
jgi:hypothetical protein